MTEKILFNSNNLREPDYYGASYIVSLLNDKSSIPISYSSWRHGWEYRPLKYLELLCHNIVSNPYKILVHTKKQEIFMRDKGYFNTYAVGMPFSYVWRYFNVQQRQPNTLLVFPPHMTKYVDIQYNEDKYVNDINKIKNKFKHIDICLTNECIKKERWIRTFKKYNYNIVRGSNVFDANSLLRMHNYFSRYEFVTSPNIGSHIVYAALCGCKVSIYGNINHVPLDSLKKDPFYSRNPHLLEYIIRDEVVKKRREIEEKFNCRPDHAKKHVQWAKIEAGINEMVEPRRLASLLGWNPLTQYKYRTKIKIKSILNKIKK